MRPWDCDPKLYKIFQAFFTIIPLKYITLWLPYFDVHTERAVTRKYLYGSRVSNVKRIFPYIICMVTFV